jgi:penicillin V acylase-like amidase (Ntn superfamily)
LSVVSLWEALVKYRLGKLPLPSSPKRTTIALALGTTLLSLSAALRPIRAAHACTRAVYLGPDDTIITVRSMDWQSDLGSNLWAFPRGMPRDGAAGPQSIRWTSRYGSVVSTAFEAATADGMNEKGVVANLLYLAESEYVKPSRDDKRLPLSFSVWT